MHCIRTREAIACGRFRQSKDPSYSITAKQITNRPIGQQSAKPPGLGKRRRLGCMPIRRCVQSSMPASRCTMTRSPSPSPLARRRRRRNLYLSCILWRLLASVLVLGWAGPDSQGWVGFLVATGPVLGICHYSLAWHILTVPSIWYPYVFAGSYGVDTGRCKAVNGLEANRGGTFVFCCCIPRRRGYSWLCWFTGYVSGYERKVHSIGQWWSYL